MSHHAAKDSSLAPVAYAIEEHLQLMRAASFETVPEVLELLLDNHSIEDSFHERSERVVAAATRNVDMHNWRARLSQDNSAIHLHGGSGTVDLAVGAAVTQYLEEALRLTTAGGVD